MKLIPLILTFSLILAACSSVPQVVSTTAPPAVATPATPTSPSTPPTNQPEPTATPSSVDVNLPTPPPAESTGQTTSSEDLVRTDEQGAVTVEVTPVNLANPGESLEFEVVLNTHSVDLSMDLATLATLTTDTGKTVQASLWDAPRGGHHVEGKLLFPAAVDGQPLLEGAETLTLTIKNLDAPERVFAWDLNS